MVLFLRQIYDFRYIPENERVGDILGWTKSKVRMSWGRLSWILSREWADPKVSGNFYKAVSQAVLLFGAETWVITAWMEQSLDSFQHRVAQRLTGRQPRRRGNGS